MAADHVLPFAEAALHARGQAYAPAISSPTIHTEAYGDVPAIDAVVTWDEQARTGLLLAVNRDANTPHTLTIDLSGCPACPVSARSRSARRNCCMRTIRTAPTPPKRPKPSRRNRSTLQ